MSQEARFRSQHRVLIVEDDASVGLALQRALSSAGHHVDIATTMRQGLAKLNGHHVALLDIDLPDGRGTTVLRWIREKGLPIRVAVYTGLIGAKAIVDACGAQPDAVFKKPVDLDRLLEWIDAN
jgi:DNA-binding response OmpR family regulator